MIDVIITAVSIAATCVTTAFVGFLMTRNKSCSLLDMCGEFLIGICLIIAVLSSSAAIFVSFYRVIESLLS